MLGNVDAQAAVSINRSSEREVVCFDFNPGGVSSGSTSGCSGRRGFWVCVLWAISYSREVVKVVGVLLLVLLHLSVPSAVVAVQYSSSWTVSSIQVIR